MRRPSPRILTNRVDVYVAQTSTDAENAPAFTYAGTPTHAGEPCSVQYTDTGQDPDQLHRLTTVNLYHVLFGRDLRLKPRDKVVWRDPDPRRTLFVEASPPSEAGRDAAFVVRCVEKL